MSVMKNIRLADNATPGNSHLLSTYSCMFAPMYLCLFLKEKKDKMFLKKKKLKIEF